ncbi:putative amidoligase domain-containing protein [Paenibacillus aceris]|uniref:Phage phiEco32-like COOH-NH2 ligase-type 2 n=1 Tax=Paenibacillus aceris TaxID=869555 RepID=A0ABS4HT75_9BACL|nr:hypothetical protein [Paenibacillus aceris]MBP1961831.1 hypothetical protein [Paenibacillus aceris]NHW34312.1 hypothetical protein [Paenibacillus aceris]
MESFLLHAQEKEALELAGLIHIPSGTKLPEDWRGRIVIHWGAAHDEWPQKQALQPIKAILRAKASAKRDERLALHGIKTVASLKKQGQVKDERLAFTHKYKVAVFHLQTLIVYEKKETLLLSEKTRLEQRQAGVNSAYFEVTPERASFHVRRASREAVKAIYALGLDYGLVTIGVLPTGHTLVLDVDPVPKLNAKLTQLFAQAIDRYELALAKEVRRKERVMLGSDPEFLLLSPQGQVVFADRFLTRAGEVGCDAVVLSGHRLILPLAELRPQPSTDPRELTRNLLATMHLAARAIPDESLAWLSGGMPVGGYPLGGHIHFSRCWLNGHLLRALDNYLALPLILIEGDTTRQRRPRYGFLGDFRKKSHGGFEYRTLPSWMQSPLITRGVFALAALIADNYWILPRQPLQEPDIEAAYYRGDKHRLQGVVARLWKDLEQLKGYEIHAAVLDRFRVRIESMEPWNEREDFRKAWKIAPYHRKEAIEEGIML